MELLRVECFVTFHFRLLMSTVTHPFDHYNTGTNTTVPEGGGSKDDGSCVRALSRVSEYRCGAIWAASQWNAALSVPQSRLSTHHFPLTIPRQRAGARGQTADRRHDAQWQWRAGYRPGALSSC